MLGRGHHDVAVSRERPIDVAELGLKRLAEAVFDLEHFVAGLRDLRLAREDGHEIGPSLGLSVQAVEGPDRDEIFGIGVDDASVPGNGSNGVLELDLEYLGVAEAKLDEALPA